jgi:hypothetical protein
MGHCCCCVFVSFGPIFALVYLIIMGHCCCCVFVSFGPIFALVYLITMGHCCCCVFVSFGPIFALVYPITMGCSSCYVFVSYGPIFVLVYPITMGGFLLCVCMWSRLCASVTHSDGLFFLLCCVCIYNCYLVTRWKRIVSFTLRSICDLGRI